MDNFPKLVCSFWDDRSAPSRRDVCRECGKEVAIGHKTEAVFKGMSVTPIPLCIPCAATNHPEAIIRYLPGAAPGGQAETARRIDGVPMSLAAWYMHASRKGKN